MGNIEQTKAILLLEDGTMYEGLAGGKIGTSVGEICFNTGMTGYQEVFTDPSYYGQTLVATNAHIGNYGAKDTDVESDRIQIAGFICKNFTNAYSRKLADSDLQSYFEANELSGTDDDSRTSASIAYRRDITDEWGMNAGLTHTRVDEAGVGDRSRNTLFFNVQRDISFGF